jgi:hypothetical protein
MKTASEKKKLTTPTSEISQLKALEVLRKPGGIRRKIAS